jgi:hypothetical protein
VRRKQTDEQLDALAIAEGLEPVTDHGTVWISALSGRGPLFVRRRARCLVARAGDEVLVIRRRRRRPITPDNVVVRLPLSDSTIVRRRRLGLLVQLVVDTGRDDTAWVLEFPLRCRGFARSVQEALA